MFKSILWPLDGSPLSVKPLPTVVDLARCAGARVTLLSIAEPRLHRASNQDALDTGRAAESIRLDAARQELDRVRSALRQAGVACDDIAALAAAPCDGIVDTAHRIRCDLIVMATHGKMGVIDTMFNVSTTQQVLKASPVPVLVFPEEERA